MLTEKTSQKTFIQKRWRHDIAEILLKLALNTNQSINKKSCSLTLFYLSEEKNDVTVYLGVVVIHRIIFFTAKKCLVVYLGSALNLFYFLNFFNAKKTTTGH